MKNIIYNIAGTIGTILLLNFLINLIFVSKNDGKKYVDEYINSCKNLKIKQIDSELFDEMFNGYS